jgi:hypothetical protein
MRRKARAVHLARIPQSQLIRGLGREPISNWPRHFQLARATLNEELSLSEEIARQVILRSAQEALDHGRAI